MPTPQDFAATVEAIISRHPDALLAHQWEEAQAVDPNPAPDTSWIRETDDLINVVWLTQRGIIDITWLPLTQTGTFSFVRLSSMVGIEVHEGPNVLQGMGLTVSGNTVATVHTSSHQAGLVWVASDDAANTSELRDFTVQVIKRIA